MRLSLVVGAMVAAHATPCLGLPVPGSTGDSGSTVEVPGPQPVVGVPTAVAAFMGTTEVSDPSPVSIRSMSDFEATFGGPPSTTDPFGLHSSLGLYFENGGAEAVVVSVGSYRAPPDRAAYEAGLTTLRSEPDPTLVALPDAASVLVPADLFAVQVASLRHCAELERFCVLDLPNPEALVDAVDGLRDALPTTHAAWGAAYTPWLELPSGEVLPPSGAIAGIYARVDRTRGVWMSPANESVNGISGLAHDIADPLQQTLIEDPTTGLSVNPIRAFAGQGILVWGARTLAGNDNEWRYVPVRRTAQYIERSIRQSTDWVLFEPNSAALWTELHTRVDVFMHELWQQGALQGATPDEGYFVQVGLDVTMTQEDVDAGRVRLMYGFAPLRPAEFITGEVIWEP